MERSVDSDMDNKSNPVPVGASQAAGHRGRHRSTTWKPQIGHAAFVMGP
jgi:hypothetical protein